MGDETPEGIEDYVLRNWKHYAGMGKVSPHVTIEFYQSNHVAFHRDKVEVERRVVEELETSERMLRDNMSEETKAVYAEIRELVDAGLSEEQIARRTGYRRSGVANVVRWLSGNAALNPPDTVIDRMVEDIREKRRMP